MVPLSKIKLMSFVNIDLSFVNINFGFLFAAFEAANCQMDFFGNPVMRTAQ